MSSGLAEHRTFRSQRQPVLIDARDVASLGYVEFMALLDETNRPPGGMATILYIRALCNITSKHRMIDVGCNTGFVSFRMAAVSGCEIVGIDLSEEMIAAANGRIASAGSTRVRFLQGDAAALPFDDEVFDIATCGGSLAFMHDAKAAVKEMARVIRRQGFVASADFFYARQPPHDLLHRLRAALQVEILAWPLEYWRSLFAIPGLELVLQETRPIGPIEDAGIDSYVDAMVRRVAHKFTAQGIDAARHRLKSLCRLFNENHRYLGVVMTICQKVDRDHEPVLFAV